MQLAIRNTSPELTLFHARPKDRFIEDKVQHQKKNSAEQSSFSNRDNVRI